MAESSLSELQEQLKKTQENEIRVSCENNAAVITAKKKAQEKYGDVTVVNWMLAEFGYDSEAWNTRMKQVREQSRQLRNQIMGRGQVPYQLNESEQEKIIKEVATSSGLSVEKLRNSSSGKKTSAGSPGTSDEANTPSDGKTSGLTDADDSTQKVLDKNTPPNGKTPGSTDQGDESVSDDNSSSDSGSSSSEKNESPSDEDDPEPVWIPADTGSSNSELDHTPVYTPYNATYGRKKTADGLSISESAVLKRYYSSIDAEVYFGNDYVEDICDIQWSLSQRNLPIYGFNSYTFDEIAIGDRIISGQFAIRFTDPNYLFKLLEQIKGQKSVFAKKYKVPLHDRVLGEPTGAIDESLKGTEEGTKLEERWPVAFDIDVVYGQPVDGLTDEVHVVLEHVRLISCQCGASITSPVPVTEVYSFVAKDIKCIS